MVSLFVSDLHGEERRYRALFEAIDRERPEGVFLGGDLLPHGFRTDVPSGSQFIDEVLAGGFAFLRARLGEAYPRVFLILGNDDPRCFEPEIIERERDGLWTYLHERQLTFGRHQVVGYACIPPTPFRLKDWERYDVGNFTDPGAISPEEGTRSVEADRLDTRHGTIQSDLERIGVEVSGDTIMLFHTPPYETALDRAALDGKTIDHVPLDVHVGSIAVRRFIESRQPAVTLHGHVHESARLTGRWMDQIGRTVLLGAAHDGPELALVRFDPSAPLGATRELV